MIKKGHKKYKQHKAQKAAKQDFVKSKRELIEICTSRQRIEKQARLDK